MNSLAKHLLRFFLPWACAGCRSALLDIEDHGFCGRCWLSIPRIQGLVCRSCGLPLPDGGMVCYSCRQAPPPLLIRAASEYRGVIRPAVYSFKYKGRKTLSRVLGTLLRQAWDHHPELHGISGVIPVPLYPANERLRGYNQAELLAQDLGRYITRPMLPALVRTKRTLPQVSLNREKRKLNVQAAFSLHPLVLDRKDMLSGRSFLLLDDVCTTASTLSECAWVLKRAGASTVKALVLARDL